MRFGLCLALSSTLQAEDLLSQSIDDVLERRLISDAEEVLLRIGGDEIDLPQESFRIDPSTIIVAKNLEQNCNIWTIFTCLNTTQESESHDRLIRVRVDPNSLSYPFPSVVHIHVRVRANSGFDRGVGVSGRGRYPLKPSIYTSLLETKGYPEHTAARSSREYFQLK